MLSKPNLSERAPEVSVLLHEMKSLYSTLPTETLTGNGTYDDGSTFTLTAWGEQINEPGAIVYERFPGGSSLSSRKVEFTKKGANAEVVIIDEIYPGWTVVIEEGNEVYARPGMFADDSKKPTDFSAVGPLLQEVGKHLEDLVASHEANVSQ
ncbi:MAG: hypothetical protein RLY61_936 [Candidatus Parcubacteria bacterium]|jgi:hypothetical protein